MEQRRRGYRGSPSVHLIGLFSDGGSSFRDVCLLRACLVSQMVKNWPAMCETWVQSLVWEDPLGEGVAATAVFLSGESPWTKEPGGLWGWKESDMTE